MPFKSLGMGFTAQNIKILTFKLQSKLYSSVQVGQGVDFIFPLSQQQQQQQEPPPAQLVCLFFKPLIL